MHYSLEKIKTILPHRAPFLFARSVEVYESGKRGSATMNFSSLEDFWQDAPFLNELNPQDFAPERNADILLLETAAQIFGVVLASGMEGKITAEGKHLLLGFDNFELGEKFIPQDDVQIDVQLDSVFGSMFKGIFSAIQYDTLVARGELTVMQGE